MANLTFEISDESMVYFDALSRLASNRFDSVQDMLEYWIHTLSDGIRRPGSWERQLLYPAFGDLDAVHDYFQTNQWGQLLPKPKGAE